MTTEKAQELTAQISASIEQLCKETDAATQSAIYRAWLSTMSRFYNYSFGNQILIWAQCPTATRVAGFHAWKDRGRSVKKGEKAIRILAPIIRKHEEKDGQSVKTPRVVAFRCATVFDVAQTEGKELPELECNATEGGEELLPALEMAATALGITLVYKSIPGATEGVSRGGTIEIEETLDTPARCGVIAHELAHEVLKHKERRAETTKQQRELEAESVAFAVLAHFGMRLESRFYLVTYDVSGEMLSGHSRQSTPRRASLSRRSASRTAQQARRRQLRLPRDRGTDFITRGDRGFPRAASHPSALFAPLHVSAMCRVSLGRAHTQKTGVCSGSTTQ